MNSSSTSSSASSSSILSNNSPNGGVGLVSATTFLNDSGPINDSIRRLNLNTVDTNKNLVTRVNKVSVTANDLKMASLVDHAAKPSDNTVDHLSVNNPNKNATILSKIVNNNVNNNQKKRIKSQQLAETESKPVIAHSAR